MTQQLHGSEVFSQVSESMRAVIEMTSRIDERVKVIMEKQVENDKRLMTAMDHLNHLSARVSILESRDSKQIEALVDSHGKSIQLLERQVEILNLHKTSSTETWKTTFSTLMQVATTLAMGWILWKLGLPSP